MKHVKIVLTLTLVVVVSSLAVFFVEQYTTPKINAYLLKQANLAKFEVLPFLNDVTDPDLTPTSDFDFTDTSIDELIIIDGVGYIYTATFQGYQSQITYMIGVDEDGNLTGYKTLSQGDTPGLGAEIANPAFFPQFVGLSVDDAEAGNFDGLSGATVTTGGLMSSLEKVMLFHKSEFMGVTIETPEERVLRLKTEITFEGATFTDVTADYELPEAITKMEMANDGTEDTAVVFTVEFDGYVDVVEYVVAFDLTTNNVLGMNILFHAETAGYGAGIDEDAYLSQFNDMALQDAIDGNIDAIAGTSNAPVTSGGVLETMDVVARFYQAEFLGIVVETTQEKIDRLLGEIYPTADGFADVTRNYPAHHDVETLYEVTLGVDVLGYAYVVHTPGASVTEETFIQYILAFDTELNVLGFALVDSNETASYYANFENDEAYDDQFVGAIAGETVEIDAPAGATANSATNNIIETITQSVLDYHEETFATRPESVAVDLADLEAAYPSAASFESVYENYTYNSKILNLYAAKDGSNNTIGYVYYTTSEGYGGTIEFLWTVDTSGITQSLYVISHGESWDDAAASEWSDYDGSVGVFPNTTWLDQFSGSDISTYNFDEIDGVSGVSTTTGTSSNTDGIMGSLQIIASYHTSENVGGGS